MKHEDVKSLHDEGFCILREQISSSWIDRLKIKTEEAMKAHRSIQIQNNNDIKEEGVALHVILSDQIFIDFLGELFKIGVLKALGTHFFESMFILNSFSALDNLPSQLNFSALVHRDTRFYTGNIPMMLNMLVMLDDFTEENGPTLLLPGSHKVKEKPSDEIFHQNAVQTLGKAGDILLFNANVWHASSLNKTLKTRKALPLTFTKSNIKQLLDYPRAIGYDKMDKFNEGMQQLLGYHARVPASLEDWYQPLKNRFYRKNQD